MAGVSLGRLCQDLSNEYVEEKFGAHSLWNPGALRYDLGSFDTIVTVLTLIQIWILEQRCDQCWDYCRHKAAHSKRPSILLFNGVLSCRAHMGLLYLGTPRTWEILDGSVFTLVRRRFWLEHGNSTFCSGCNLDNEELK
jgi:hypothetical protein